MEENAAEEQEKELGRGKREKKLSGKFEGYVFNYIFLTYKEAIEGPEKDLWNKAIEEEKKSLKQNNVWTLVPRMEAKNKKILSNKWIFKLKDDGRYKARIIRGCELRTRLRRNVQSGG